MDIIARLTKILMDGRITISAVVIHDAVLITAVSFLIRDRWVQILIFEMRWFKV